MPKPKKQHYVPQFFLRNFANEGGGMYSCRAENKEDIFGSRVEDLFTMNHVHTKTLADGSKNFEAEDAFVEEKIGPALFEKILHDMRERRSRPHLNANEQATLIECIARLVTRDPDHFGKIAEDRDFEGKLRETIQLYARSEAEKAHFLEPKEFERIKHYCRADALPMKPELLIENLSQFGLVFQKLKENVPPLIVGNQFWVVDSHRSNSMPWVPIAHDAIIAFRGKPGSIEFCETGHSAKVRSANAAIARQCRQIAGRSEADIRALAKHLTTAPRGLAQVIERREVRQG